jgi:hypothetical protein
MFSKSLILNYCKQKFSKIIFLGFILFLVILMLFLVNNQSIQLPINDFTLYWSSSKLLLSGGNPYDPDGLFLYQAQEAGNNSGVVLMYYPPWTLLFTLPFGLLDREIGQLAYILISTTVMFICTEKLWSHLGGSFRHRWLDPPSPQ